MRLRGLVERLLQHREESLAIQSIVLTAARGFGLVLTFAIPIVLVRVFTQAEFGVYKQLFLISSTAVPILSLGLYASIFYFVPRDEAGGGRYLTHAVALLSLTGASAAAALTFWAEPIAAALQSPELARYLPILGLFVLLSTPSELVASAPIVDQRSHLAAFTMAFSDLLRAGSIVLAALWWRSIAAVVWAAVIVAVVRMSWLMIYMHLRKPEGRRADRPNGTDLSRQLRYALPFAAAVFFEIGLARFHEYYVAAHSSAEQFALYAVGILHLPMVGMLVQSVVEVMLVRCTEAFKQGDLGEMRRVWTAALQRLSTLLIPAFVVAQLLAPDLIVFLFGADYAPAVPIFRVFLCVILTLIIVDHGVLRATNDTDYMLLANVIGLVVSVAAILLLAERSLLLGAVAGYMCGRVTIRVLGLLKVARRLELAWWRTLPWQSLAGASAASAVGVLIATAGLALPTPFLRLAVSGVLFATAYTAMAFWWELVPREEVRQIARKLSPLPARARV